MNVLAEILSSRVRAEVFRLLFGGAMPELHHREIVRRSGLSEGAVRQELNKLSRLDLIKRRKDGNRVYYAANREHPLHQELRRIVLKTVGLVGVLRERLQENDIRVAFVFGSIARGEETAGSDIDLMVIGNVGLRKLSSLLSEVTEQLGREVNPHVMTKTEYRKRSKKGDHFVTHVLDGPKFFIVGTERDFEAMGK
ncbi:MAG: nucleotidyltransferase domain-containing protein [Planctomycetota bacterium]